MLCRAIEPLKMLWDILPLGITCSGRKPRGQSQIDTKGGSIQLNLTQNEIFYMKKKESKGKS